MERACYHPGMRFTLLVTLALSLIACNPSDEMVQISGTPASRGTDGVVRLEQESDYANTTVSIELTHVTPPERINQSARVYVVWARQDGATIRLGKLDFDDKSREATFEGTVFRGPFELLVTAEASAGVRMPSANLLIGKTMRGGQ